MSLNRIKTILDKLAVLRYAQVLPVNKVQIAQAGYTFGESFDAAAYTWRPYAQNEVWGGEDKHFCFLAQVEIPASFNGCPAELVLETGAFDIWDTDNPQVLVYRGGKLAATMDMNHQTLALGTISGAPSTEAVAFYAYSNHSQPTSLFRLKLRTVEKEIESLYYDMLVVYEAALLLPKDELAYTQALQALQSCAALLPLQLCEGEALLPTVRKAAASLQSSYYANRPESPITVYSVGHTHIDVAWKWPLRQTRQKVVRSFLTATNLMQQYPDMKFYSSQPQLYEYVKQGAPGLFKQIQQYVKQGRWEVGGAMWVEPDCLLPSGEALIRQVLYGRRFFKQEFGTQSDEVLWLPDAFGYNAALPQIMQQCGMRYFVSTKMGWNDTNKFPYDTFEWQGIDGTKVLAYFITTRNYGADTWETTYNGRQNASQIAGTWQRYSNKEVSTKLLTCYGYGDGGGGPTQEMLQQDKRLRHSVGSCPKTKQAGVREFFADFEADMNRSALPVWRGELYLEYHRGTYTSMAKNKYYNRKCEFLLADAELFAVLAGEAAQMPYPAEKLDIAWKHVLLNQFHDILPGSAIKEVYDESWQQYEEAAAIANEIIVSGQQALLGGKPAGKAGALAVFNTLPFARTALVEVPAALPKQAAPGQATQQGSWVYLAAQVPAKGVAPLAADAAPANAQPVCSAFIPAGSGHTLETPFYTIALNAQGELTSLFDKRNRREVLVQGAVGNRLMAYQDIPKDFDAWNIDSSYTDKSEAVAGLTFAELVENGPVRAVLQLRRQYRESEISQQICLYAHTPRIDFVTDINWHQHQVLLKAEFPVDIETDTCTYDIQFGNISRPITQNTSWEKARFEVPAHKWADCSEAGYGVALLNDCKYGYSVQPGKISLTLLKSGIFPNPQADQGAHHFTYALYPHAGGWREGGVVQQAYDLNCPLYAVPAASAPEAQAYFTLDAENVLLDTVKQSENGTAVVLRLYECYGKRTQVQLQSPLLQGSTAHAANALEEKQAPIPQTGNALAFTMRPYEIKTIVLEK